MVTQMSVPPEILFHYATLAGAHGIATTKRLWATNIGHLADATEFSYAHEVLRQALEYGSRGQSADVSATIAALVGDLLFAQKQKNLIFSGSPSSVYIASLSENGDQLSQWRTYCPGGGYALGFRTDALRVIASEQGFDLVRCSYDKAHHWNEAQQLADDVMARIQTVPSEVRASIPADIKNVSIAVLQYLFPIKQYMLDEIQKRAPSWKHPSFNEEAEWRLVSKHRERAVKFRVGRAALIPYAEVELDRPSTKSGDLLAVLLQTNIGPSAEPELAAGSVMHLFDVEKVGCPQYMISSTPYRQW